MFKNLKTASQEFNLDTDRTKKFRARRDEIQNIMRSYYPADLNSDLNYKVVLVDIQNKLTELRRELRNLEDDEEYFEHIMRIFEGDDYELQLDDAWDSNLTGRQYKANLDKKILDTRNKINDLKLKREQYRALRDINKLSIVAQKKRLRKSQKHSRSSRASRKVGQRNRHRRSRPKTK